MATTYSSQSMVQKDVFGGLMGVPPMSDPEIFDIKEGNKDPNGTPMSQATTAPNTPYFTASLPDPFRNDSDADEEESWSRQSSPFSTFGDEEATPTTTRTGAMSCFLDAINEELEEVKALAEEKEKREQADESDDDDDSIEWITEGNTQNAQETPAAQGVVKLCILEGKLDEVKNLYREKYGQDVDIESDIEADFIDQDGTPWTCTSGRGPLTVAALEHKLYDLKNVYWEKYGQAVDSESDTEDELIDEDGTPWVCMVGCGPLTVAALDEKLAQVKKLYMQKHGEDVDGESDIECDLLDSDGTPWICTVGNGLATMDALEAKLDVVKKLYMEKYGEDVDSESESDDDLVDEDGTPWIHTVGSGPATMDALEMKLDEVKTLYREKYGQDVDTESETECDLLDSDGTPWMCTDGSGLATMGALEKKLAEVKALYREKYGHDADSESESACDLVDEDGTPWMCTEGCGPATMDVLEQKLVDVKNLYKEKYGQDVDIESEIDCDLLDSDGTPWICTLGGGPVNMSVLQSKLDEVKSLYRGKYGEDVDSASESECGLVDEDGTAWIYTVGSGPATMDALEMKLDDVKTLYREKYGQDVDSESESECDTVDSDGTPWICTVGSGLATMGARKDGRHVKTLSSDDYGQDVDSESEVECDLLVADGNGPLRALVEKLYEVKMLYREKYGQDVDIESEADCDLVDGDGTPWIGTVGCGAATVRALEKMLDEVKDLYMKKYGEDVDGESDIECDLLDSDGTPWICTVGSGLATMDALEDKLDAVKKLYREKYGEDVGSESETDDDLVDEDGTPWNYTVGSGPATMDALEMKLDELKTLYSEKYGQDVDSESESECDLLDSDGTPWICTVGGGLVTMSVLEMKLAEIKNLYMEKYGQDVDGDSESACDLVDEDGTPWICTVGTGPATMLELEHKLEEVKRLYMEKYGQGVDSELESDCDLLDSDGTPWICIDACGLATMGALEVKLDEVKKLYRKQYGRDVDSESESECDLVDSDGTPWRCTVGSGPATMDMLEEKLEAVKKVYKEKYCQDVDKEFHIEYDMLDSDGTPWICTHATGLVTMDLLAEKLDEVKSMYLEKHGQDVDSESEDEYDLLDSDGTPWIATLGSGPATMDALEEKLQAVKKLYKKRYGQDVDNESEIECDMLDSDGTPWIGTLCSGIVTLGVLEKKLNVLKNMYLEKYGEDVDSESEIECDLLDSDGTPWIGTFGSGPTTIGDLEDKLDKVKRLYMEKYGQDVDTEPAGLGDLVDEDGTPWMCTVGNGPVTITSLEEKLDEVKNFYKIRYGIEIDSETDDEDTA